MPAQATPTRPAPARHGSEPLAAHVHRAVELCRQEEWAEGLDLARLLVAEHGKSELPGVVFSYLGYGVARFDHNLAEGLSLCRYATKRSPMDPETFFNLARIELLARRRKFAVRAVSKGLALNPRHRALRELQRAIGWRRPPVLSILSRENPINRLLGRIRARLEPEQSQTDRAIW